MHIIYNIIKIIISPLAFRYEIFLFRAIAVIEDTFNIMLLVLFLYFGILFACYGFLIMSVSDIF